MRSLKIGAAALAAAAALAWNAPASAHCDTLDGPVVSAAREALDSKNLAPALAWVAKRDEAEIRAAFDKASRVRRSGGEAKALADAYFFETLVRVHRAGEGAGFTGLKPAGEVEPAVAAADRAISTGDLRGLTVLVHQRADQGLHRHFQEVMAKRAHRPDDVEAGRAYVKAYVEFVHYADRVYSAADAPAGHAH